MALTGTPFRSDTSPIPFVTYEVDNDGIRRSKADYSYGYGPALKDHVVRPVIFMAYSGQMRWRTSAGEEMAANLGEGFTKTSPPRRGEPPSTPTANGFPTVLAAADKRLTEVRRTVPACRCACHRYRPCGRQSLRRTDSENHRRIPRRDPL